MPAELRSLRLSPLALDDLENIWTYTAQRWSEDQAESYHADFVAAFEGLASSIKRGRPVDVRVGYLKYAVGAHLIFYLQTDTTIDVMRILHQSMDADRHL